MPWNIYFFYFKEFYVQTEELTLFKNFVLFLENCWILSLLVPYLRLQSMANVWDNNIPTAPFSQSCNAESLYQNTENKCDKQWMSCCLQALVGEQIITRTHWGCLSLEWQVTIFIRKESKASFINSVDSCLTDWLPRSLTGTAEMRECRCCKHIKTRSPYHFRARKSQMYPTKKKSKQCRIRTFDYGDTLFLDLSVPSIHHLSFNVL